MTMGAPKARQIRRNPAGDGFQAWQHNEWRDVGWLAALPNSELRRCAMLRFPQVKGNLWMSVSKRDTLRAVETGVLPDSMTASDAGGPDNSQALCDAQDEIARLRDEIDRLSRERVAMATPQVVINLNDPPASVSRRHACFDKVFALAQLGVNIYLVGPAGTGKTTLAEQVAEALSLPFRALSCHAQMTGTALFGYTDANGNYVPTDYRRMATGEYHDDGAGLFLIDEIDNGNPNIIASLNSALANGYVAFPDGLRKVDDRHIVMASANTYGTGATLKYLGRNGLDAASLDRFVMVPVDYDTALERELASQYGPAGTEWCERIHAYRESAERQGLDVVLSMRAIVDGAKMLAAGFDIESVLSMRVFRGLQSEVVRKVRTVDGSLSRRSASVAPATADTDADTDHADVNSIPAPNGYVRTTAKFPSTCDVCHDDISVGEGIYWRKRTTASRASVRHAFCHHNDQQQGI